MWVITVNQNVFMFDYIKFANMETTTVQKETEANFNPTHK